MILSKNKIKFIRQLATKKRDNEQLFIAEGTKLIADLAATMRPITVVATGQWFETHNIAADEHITVASQAEMKSISTLTTPTDVLAIFRQPKPTTIADIIGQPQLIIALDTVQDPGNMGTIIRTADWFGIRHIICSKETADIYNPKVIQSTMGAIARVAVHYTDLDETLGQFNKAQYPIYGTYLDGENIYHKQLTDYGIIVMGNEGNGISPQTSRHINNRLLIPPTANATTVRSLNVGIATAIVCSEFRRPKQ